LKAIQNVLGENTFTDNNKGVYSIDNLVHF
jgi:hypothetical protein